MSPTKTQRTNYSAGRGRSGGGRRAVGSRPSSYRRRRLGFAFTVAGIAIIVGFFMAPYLNRAVREISLPLHHADIIRQQAAKKHIDPALIAAVIYAESRFQDQTSRAGAKGLMQLLPSTAEYIARKSGGVKFERGDLATPQVNISYGSFYLRYLLNEYHNKVALALAAYNAGEGKVNGWMAAALARRSRFDVAQDIPFEETRNYVVNVLDARKRYRARYAKELGLS